VSRLSTPELTVLPKRSQMPEVAEPRAVGPVRVGIGAIARHDPAFVQLYYAIEARRTSSTPLVIQFISPTPGTGASTVASGYARVAADDCSEPVLYVDCSGAAEPSGARPKGVQEGINAPTLSDTLRHDLPLSDASLAVRDANNLLWARLGPGARPLLAMGADRLQALLDKLRAHHPVVVLDSPSANVPEAAALSRYCDGSVLVVAAGRTRQSEIEEARTMIERLGGQTVGIVLNRERQYRPRLLGRGR
jgi:Mrp family chromosome partitioning ATPase